MAGEKIRAFVLSLSSTASVDWFVFGLGAT